MPPPPQELAALLTDWERFANEHAEMPLLIQNALLHSQFETIHPFLDGNGRLGGLVLVFFLVARGRLTVPLLYLSAYLERERQRYYDSLGAIQERGDPVPWIDLFLSAVETQASDAVTRAQRIIELRESYRTEAATLGTANALPLIDLVCENPLMTARLVEKRPRRQSSNGDSASRQARGPWVLTESDPGRRGQRRYVAREMMAALTGVAMGGNV